MTENTSAASNATTKSDKTAALEPDQDIRDQARKKAAELEEIYEPGARPTVVVPGTDGMVAGTAFAGMVDEQITENKPPDHPRKEDAS